MGMLVITTASAVLSSRFAFRLNGHSGGRFSDGGAERHLGAVLKLLYLTARENTWAFSHQIHLGPALR
jgi:hypothetical protein